MDYKISDVEQSFDGRIVENLGSNDYVIKINDREHQLRILGMDARGIEFVLDQQYHSIVVLDVKQVFHQDVIILNGLAAVIP